MKPIHLAMGPPRRALVAWLLGHTAHRWQQGLALTLLVAAATALAGAAWQAWQLRQQATALTEATDALASMPARPARAPATPVPGAPAAQEARAWHQVMARLNTPWPAIFDALDRATPAGVALLGIDPRPAEGSIRIQAEARTLDELLKYTAQLQAAPPFGQVLLVKHETHEQDPQRPVRLTLEVRLRTPEARP